MAGLGIKDAELGLKGHFIPKDLSPFNLSADEKEGVKNSIFILLYGKVRGQQVDISFDCIYNDMLRRLMNPEIRARMGVSSLNDFAFATTTGTKYSMSGGNAIRDTKERCGLQKDDIIHATAYRHFRANITVNPAFLKN